MKASGSNLTGLTSKQPLKEQSVNIWPTRRVMLFIFTTDTCGISRAAMPACVSDKR
jgi:hypothetical protein